VRDEILQELLLGTNLLGGALTIPQSLLLRADQVIQ